MLKKRLTVARETLLGLRMGLDHQANIALIAARDDAAEQPMDLGLRVDQVERELRELQASIRNWRLANNLLHETRHEASKARRAGGASC